MVVALEWDYAAWTEAAAAFINDLKETRVDEKAPTGIVIAQSGYAWRMVRQKLNDACEAVGVRCHILTDASRVNAEGRDLTRFRKGAFSQNLGFAREQSMRCVPIHRRPSSRRPRNPVSMAANLCYLKCGGVPPR